MPGTTFWLTFSVTLEPQQIIKSTTYFSNPHVSKIVNDHYYIDRRVVGTVLDRVFVGEKSGRIMDGPAFKRGLSATKFSVALSSQLCIIQELFAFDKKTLKYQKKILRAVQTPNLHFHISKLMLSWAVILGSLF